MSSCRTRTESTQLILLGVLFMCLSGAPARAQYLYTQLFYGAGNNNITTGPSGSGLPEDSLSGKIEFTDHFGSGTMTLNADTKAKAEFGILHSKVSALVQNPYYNPANPDYFDGVTVNPDGSPGLMILDARAAFVDVLTFTGGFGDEDTVQFTYTVDGVISQSSPHTDFAFILFKYGGDVEEDYSTDLNHTEFVTAPHSVQWDQGVEVDTTLVTDFDFFLDGGGRPWQTPFTPGVDYHGIADFYNTARLTKIEIFDANQNPITSFLVSSASGTQYPVPGAVAVPEPALMTLLFAALIPLGFLARRRRA